MGGQQIIPLAIKGSVTGNANTTHTFTEECEGISIVNRGIATVTFTINGISTTVAPGETFNGYFRDFTQVIIVATDDYAITVHGR